MIAERPALKAYEGRDVLLGIRPEDLEDAGLADGAVPPERTIPAVVTLRETAGPEAYLHVRIGPDPSGATAFVARVSERTTAREGDRVALLVDTAELRFDPGTGDKDRGGMTPGSAVGASLDSSGPAVQPGRAV